MFIRKNGYNETIDGFVQGTLAKGEGLVRLTSLLR
jgi:hypothetical protein